MKQTSFSCDQSFKRLFECTVVAWMESWNPFQSKREELIACMTSLENIVSSLGNVFLGINALG